MSGSPEDEDYDGPTDVASAWRTSTHTETLTYDKTVLQERVDRFEERRIHGQTEKPCREAGTLRKPEDIKPSRLLIDLVIVQCRAADSI